MEHFEIYQREGNCKKPIYIEDLIPFGRDNAICRDELLMACEIEGLCSTDRKMRKLIQDARVDCVILNNSDGWGYYRPTLEDLHDLQRYIRQEEKRAKVVFRDIKKARALYEDLQKGRLSE